MKVLSSPQSPRQGTARRVSKPQMEKRRRERINHSLETLRLLMLESTHNEKLKNPKVEKAEILESVVDFLKMEQGQATKGVLPREQSASCAHQHNYHDGMRSCLLRVSQFVTSKSQESEQTGGAAFTLPEPQTHSASASLSPQHLPQLSHPHITQMTGLHPDTRTLLASTVVSTHVTDSVWRPWPQ